jgi:hypothetical protein
MRAGEASMLESLKHMITLIKLGSVKEGFAPTEEQIQKAAAALAGGSQSHYFIWDDLIEGEVLQPDLGRMLDPKKYESINQDIFWALGVSSNIMAGNGSYANSFLGIKILLEKLETLRNKVIDWLVGEIKVISERMKFKRLPKVQFGRVSLRDESAERTLAVQLFDRGILSAETLLDMFGENWEIEQARLEETKSKKFKGPYIKDPPTGVNGRPTNTKNIPQKKKRNTIPQGQNKAGLIKWASETYDEVFNLLSVKAGGDDPEKISELTNITFSLLEPFQEINDALVYDIASNVFNIDSPFFTNGTLKNLNASTKLDKLEFIITYVMGVKNVG